MLMMQVCGSAVMCSVAMQERGSHRWRPEGRRLAVGVSLCRLRTSNLNLHLSAAATTSAVRTTCRLLFYNCENYFTYWCDLCLFL